MYHYPIKVISDLHYRYFGARFRHPDELRDILAGCRTLILNGDSVEEHVWGQEAANRHRSEIEMAAARAGVHCVFLRGNHDPSIGADFLLLSHKGREYWIHHGDFGVLPLRSSRHSMFRRPLEYSIHYLKTLRTYYVYWRQVEMAFALRRPESVLILGHTHQPSLTCRGGQTVINLGAHLKGFRAAHVLFESEIAEPVFVLNSKIAI
jgi:predicted phosphodiesterase